MKMFNSQNNSIIENFFFSWKENLKLPGKQKKKMLKIPSTYWKFLKEKIISNKLYFMSSVLLQITPHKISL